MTLEQEVLAVIRTERSLWGSARLSVREISKRVERSRWESLSPAEKLVHFVNGACIRPTDEDVHEAIHELQKTHSNLVSVTHAPRPQVASLRLVHSR